MAGIDSRRLVEASKFLKIATPDAIKTVLHGEIGLDKAGEKVIKDRKAGRCEADRLARLRDDRPDPADHDLAALVPASAGAGSGDLEAVHARNPEIGAEALVPLHDRPELAAP